MQRLLGISIFILLMLFPTGNGNAAVSCPANAEDGYIEDSLKSGVVSLYDILQDCCFELPQNAYTALSRQGKQHSTGQRINDNSKNGTPLCQQQSTSRPATYIFSCHMAVAASRHSRGYYIYALRHIII